jgi:excinuclease ABC subunit A
VLHHLRDRGNTIVIIEHNLDVIKTADWVVDLGPEGGSGGGQIIAEGTPEEIIKVKQSHTGKFLKPLLNLSETKKAATKKAGVKKPVTKRTVNKEPATKKATTKKPIAKKTKK